MPQDPEPMSDAEFEAFMAPRREEARQIALRMLYPETAQMKPAESESTQASRQQA